jgi:hypothetical protein
MGRRELAVLALALFAGIVSQAEAADTWVVRAVTQGQPLDQGCRVVWADRLTFFNFGSGQVVVNLISVSNGELRGTPSPLPLPAGSAREVRSEFLFGDDVLGWQPIQGESFAPLSVARLDVPQNVVVSSRIEIREACPSSTPLGFSTAAVRGSIAVPIRESLHPAGQPHIHLATDIGYRFTGETFATILNRINVGVYNAASISATADIEVRRTCDSGLITRRTVIVPGQTIQQFSGFSNPGVPVQSCTSVAPYETYVVVTMDQPGFSYALALSNESSPFVPVGIGIGK